MRAAIVLAALLTSSLATLLLAAPAAQAGSRPAEARWCTAQAIFIDVQWDCRYPTRAACEATAPRNRACLQNPNWHLYRSVRR